MTITSLIKDLSLGSGSMTAPLPWHATTAHYTTTATMAPSTPKQASVLAPCFSMNSARVPLILEAPRLQCGDGGEAENCHSGGVRVGGFRWSFAMQRSSATRFALGAQCPLRWSPGLAVLQPGDCLSTSVHCLSNLPYLSFFLASSPLTSSPLYNFLSHRQISLPNPRGGRGRASSQTPPRLGGEPERQRHRVSFGAGPSPAC
ncbi:protein FAM53B-like protein [Lates japonicus]|uniref:Protein FAM53B-like protein n=1 Tax=Lates japonicus TaxID=270547 RepID=A0AAD3MZF9_LATJO|nr:protein FAM53B-like protein [Lates japonicus]